MKTTLLRKEIYVDNLPCDNKPDMICKKMPNDVMDFYRNEKFKDALVMQDCSDMKSAIRVMDNNDSNRYYWSKLDAIFKDKYKTHIVIKTNLVDYLYELDKIEELDESKIISHLSRLVNKDEFKHEYIFKIIDNILKLNRDDIQRISQYIEKLTQ